ncbi:MAG: DUF6134 family protein, partial [Pseudomonadota bacterium]
LSPSASINEMSSTCASRTTQEHLTQSVFKMEAPRTFAYWNPSLLDSNFLLNTQTGEYEKADLKETGETPLKFKGQQYGDRKYRLGIENKPAIDLWYSDDNDWLALQTNVSKGRTLTYIKRQVN